MVKRENLLVIAGLFWLFAGVNVAGIGVRSFFSVEVGAWPWMLAVMAVVFVAFGLMFRKVSRKHAARIMAHPRDRVSFIRTFDAKGYLIIAIMMGGGIALPAGDAVRRFPHRRPQNWIKAGNDRSLLRLTPLWG